MDTKFKNKDLLITALDKCIEFKYYPSAMVDMRYMITHNNATLEQALDVCMQSSLQDRVYRKVSKMYHSYIRVFNINKLFKKKQKENNDKVQE